MEQKQGRKPDEMFAAYQEFDKREREQAKKIVQRMSELFDLADEMIGRLLPEPARNGG